jgi:hypothetical protein
VWQLEHKHNPLLESWIRMQNISVNPERHLSSYKAHWQLARIWKTLSLVSLQSHSISHWYRWYCSENTAHAKKNLNIR